MWSSAFSEDRGCRVGSYCVVLNCILLMELNIFYPFFFKNTEVFDFKQELAKAYMSVCLSNFFL